jgi:predicted nucleic acid-binding protein
VRVSDRTLSVAGNLQPAALRTLDAIHLATILQLGKDLARVVAYDERLAAAARTLGSTVVSPA